MLAGNYMEPFPNIKIIWKFIYFFLLFTEKQIERKDSSPKDISTNDISIEGKETKRSESLLTKPEPVEERRGRYWNYEHNRWSFCSGKV